MEIMRDKQTSTIDSFTLLDKMHGPNPSPRLGSAATRSLADARFPDAGWCLNPRHTAGTSPADTPPPHPPSDDSDFFRRDDGSCRSREGC
jgi:hypothetical protein